ncbi:MAG: CHASE2 domain-containing protein [Saprospiraceae bacterium]
MPWRHILRPHNLLATAFIFLVMWLLSFIHIDHHKLDPYTYAIRDYDITDIVYSRLRKPEIVPESRIVLVNTGMPDRLQLYQMLERILAAKPKVIGIDIFLEDKKDPVIDSLLRQTFRHHPNIVLATQLENPTALAFDRETGCDTSFSNYAQTGFADFPGNDTRTIRQLIPKKKSKEYTAYSFAAEISRLYDPRSLEDLEKRGHAAERIHFTTTIDNYLRFEPETILDTTVDLAEIMQDKIVLLGYLNEYGPDDPIVDRFFTPMNKRYSGRTIPDMYGVVVHANVIQMLLDRNYISNVPGWIIFTFTLLLIYANTFFFFWNYKYFWYFKHFPKILYRWAHIVQVLEIALLFFLTAWIFYAFQLTADFTVATVALLLTFDLCIVYYHLRHNIPALDRIPTHFRSKRAHHPHPPPPVPPPPDGQANPEPPKPPSPEKRLKNKRKQP